MSDFAILLAGPVMPTPRLLRLLKGRRVIAADGGLVHARLLGLLPELWVGDCDSTPAEAFAAFPKIARSQLARDKDLTDGEAAISAARQRGGDDLVLVGALRGARTDHAMTNLALALSLREKGVRVRLADGVEEATPLTVAACRIGLPPGTPFSILAFGDIEGLSIKGARWPLDDVDVEFGTTRIQSNEALGPIDVWCRRGRAILVAHLAPNDTPAFTGTTPIA